MIHEKTEGCTHTRLITHNNEYSRIPTQQKHKINKITAFIWRVKSYCDGKNGFLQKTRQIKKPGNFTTRHLAKMSKVGRVYPMVSEFRMEQYRDDDHRETHSTLKMD